MTTYLANPDHIDVEFPQDPADEVRNLRALLADARQRVRDLERQIEHDRGSYCRPRVLTDGHDPHPAWDYVASVVVPTVREGHDNREALAQYLTLGAYSYPLQHDARYVAVLCARMASCLIGNKAVEEWAERHQTGLMKNDLKSLVRTVSRSFW